MKNFSIYLLLTALLFGSASTLVAQSDTLAGVFRPRIGLGVGTMTYYGEIQNYQKKFIPTVNRYYGTAYVNFPMTKFFNAEFSAAYGKISANERTIERNLNFESRIRMATIQLYYNFYPLLRPGKTLFHPFVGVGLTSFEFLSKTDMYDASGNQYHYWSDGSIMNMPENSPSSSMATALQRDYTYETDLREQNLDSLGKYREQSFAIPLTVGMEWHLTPRWDFRFASTFYMTFTDLIDNISPAGEGPQRHGDGKKDKLWTTYISLSYDLQLPREKGFDPSDDSDIELYADFDQSDWDKDGVIDAHDECPYTPLEALVDERGCPLDADGDGVPDYKDDEPNTPEGNFVDEFGVTMSEEDIAKHWREFNDSTGYDHDFIENKMVVEFGHKGEPQLVDPYADKKNQNKNYVIIIGKEQKDVNANDLYKYLGYNDFKSETRGDTVFYILGEYATIEEAVAAKTGMENSGIPVDLIGRDGTNQNTFIPVDEKVIEKVELANIENGTETPEIATSDQQLYRVQIGAFKKKVNTDELFPGLEITEVASKDGITRYYTGKYEDYEEANSHRKKMIGKGYKTAFVVAYKGQSRVTLKEAGIVEPNLPDNYNEDKELANFVEPRDTSSSNATDNNTIVNGYDLTKVKYRVLLAETTTTLSNEIVDILYNIGNIKPVKKFDGSTQYLSPKFNSIEDANNAMIEYKTYGLEDIKPIVDYEGEFMTIEEFNAKTNQ